jgi:uncharacterized protein involved in exopolysaccharide biosynthesis
MDDLSTPTGLPTVTVYSRFLRRHRVLLLCLVTLGLLSGLVWSVRQPATYSATTSIAFVQVPKYVTTPGELLSPAVTVDTDAQLLSSPEVVDAIAHQLGIDPGAVEPRVSVTASANSHVLHVTVESRSRTRAAAAANAGAAALIGVRRASLGALQDEQLNLVRIMLADHEERLARAQRRRLVVPATDELFTSVLTLRQAVDELESARDRPAEVLRSAEPPKSKDYANTEVPVTSGPMVGLLVGCLLGAARDRGLLRAPVRATRLSVNPASPVTG